MARSKSRAPRPKAARPTGDSEPAAVQRLKDWLGTGQALWAVLLQGATWICAVVAGFQLPPSFLGLITGQVLSTESLSKLAQLVVTVLLGVGFALAVRSQRLKTVLVWSLCALGSLAVAVACLFLYLGLVSSWTCTYQDARVVVGDELTQPHGVDYMKGEGKGQSCETWIDDHIGNVQEIWTRRSILQRELVLLFLYIATFPLFALCLMATIQTTAEATRRTRR
jgi:hypothetical protein